MLLIHEDAEHFAEALNYTEAETSFAAYLVEKDYYCTIVLTYLAERTDTLVFKGGTCLAKIHADFFRLSEDLDFMISVTEKSTRSQRRTAVAPVKASLTKLATILPCLQVAESFKGANNSTQYTASIGYPSVVTGQQETIKIEVALREPLLTPMVSGQVRTILIDPVSGRALVEPVSVPCMSLEEAFAEKFRAALSRLDVAVRDFFDLDYAVRKLKLQPDDMGLIRLIQQKLAVSGTGPVNVSERRLTELQQQVEPQLRPVLRKEDFMAFDVNRAFQLVAHMAEKVS